MTELMTTRTGKRIYRDGDRLIKVFPERFTASDVLNESFNLAVVGETGFRVPKLYEVEKIDGCWAIVMDYLEGETLADRMERQPEALEKHWELLVEVQLEMHGFKASRLRHHTDKMHAKISASGLEATIRYELHTRLNGLPKHNKLCHGDLNPSNIILVPGEKPYVIDWSHATQGNASADAARTYLILRLAGRDAEADLYLDLFCQKSDTARQYVQKWFAIVAASQLVKGKPEEKAFLESWANVVEYQ